MNIFSVPHRIVRRIKRIKEINGFKDFDNSSCFDENCKFSGKERITVGKDCYFGPGSEIIALNNHFSQQLDSSLTIGNHVRMTARVRITCAGKIQIGNDVLMAPEVFISDHNHGMDPEYKGGYSPQSLIIKNVIIEDGVWLGQRVCVLPGVTIGNHSIIGAASVVTHNIPPYTIAVGSPAKVVKKWDHDKKEWMKV